MGGAVANSDAECDITAGDLAGGPLLTEPITTVSKNISSSVEMVGQSNGR